MKILSLPRSTALLLSAGLFLRFGAAGALAADSKVDMSDKSFVTDAGEAGMAEVKEGLMTVGKTSNTDVQKFGKRMDKDHSKANEELRKIARSKEVEFPTSPSLVQQAKAKLLDGKSGADFDKAYASDAVSDHKDAVKLFAKEAKEGDDADLKAFAAKTLPTLKMHLKMAEELEAKVGK
jgi:putative membrane protein